MLWVSPIQIRFFPWPKKVWMTKLMWCRHFLQTPSVSDQMIRHHNQGKKCLFFQLIIWQILWCHFLSLLCFLQFYWVYFILMDLAWVYNVTNMNVLVADNLPCKYLVASSLNACFPYQLTHMCTPQGSKFYCFRNSTRSKRNIVTFVQSQCLCKPVYSVLPVHISLQFLSMQTSLQRFACTHQFTAFCLYTPVYSVLPVHTSLQRFACTHQFTAFCLYTPVYIYLLET